MLVMALVSPSDQQKLRELFGTMTRSVRLLFFTQTLECETCPETRQILAELPPLSDKITVEEVNLILEGDRARQYGIDRAPAVAIEYSEAQGVQGAGGAKSAQSAESGQSAEGGEGAERAERAERAKEAQSARSAEVAPVNGDHSVQRWTDSRIRFLGAPAGYEFISLVQAVMLAGGPSTLSETSRRHLAAVDRPVIMNVFTTPT
jgi:hypothetical protein